MGTRWDSFPACQHFVVTPTTLHSLSCQLSRPTQVCCCPGSSAAMTYRLAPTALEFSYSDCLLSLLLSWGYLCYA